MNDMAKVFWDGDDQAVELPEGYRFDSDAVRIRREGHCVVLEPVDEDAVDAETGLTVRALRALIQEGLDSGPDEPWDGEETKRAGRARLAAEGVGR